MLPLDFFLLSELISIMGGLYIGILFLFEPAYVNPYVFRSTVVVQLMLFSLALANRFRRLQSTMAARELQIQQEQQSLKEQKLLEISRINEEKNRELELRVKERTAALERANQTKNQLFRIISHDIRNPLTAIISMLKLKQYGVVSEQDFLAKLPELEVQTQAAISLTESLLKWAELQMDGMVQNPELFRLGPLALQEIKIASPLAAQKDIKIEEEIPEYITLYADKNQVKIILRNLLSNAIKFTGKGGRIVLRGHSLYEQNRLWTEFSIRDNGTGMSEKVINHLFDRHRITTRGTQGEVGSGLGLMFCKDFAEANQGSIRAESEPEKGTCFYVRLPAKAAEE